VLAECPLLGRKGIRCECIRKSRSQLLGIRRARVDKYHNMPSHDDV
jgi:hypothetical protein